MTVRFNIGEANPDDFEGILHPWFLGFLEDREGQIEEDDYDENQDSIEDNIANDDGYYTVTFTFDDWTAMSITLHDIPSVHLTVIK